MAESNLADFYALWGSLLYFYPANLHSHLGYCWINFLVSRAKSLEILIAFYIKIKSQLFKGK